MTTPMFRQFHALKEQQPDAVLFFRMGDFYETFFDDAVVAARVLDLTLTSRDKNAAEPVPMAGVPHHAVAAYVQRMTDAGYKVAIAEQMEDPATAPGLVRRAITRVVTPGVTFDPGALQARAACWLAAVAQGGKRGLGLALLDVSTGDLRACTLTAAETVTELSRFEPREVLLGPRLDDEALAAAVERCVRSEVPREAWDAGEALRELCETLDVADVAGFGLDRDEPAVIAAGAALRYARESLGQRPTNVTRLRTWRPGSHLVVDETTRRNLELFRSLRAGDKRGTLFELLDEAVTAMGSRLLREWLAMPLGALEAIAGRQAAVAALVEDADAREALRAGLRQVADVERITARIAQRTGHARDLVGLRRSLEALPGALAGVSHVAALRPHLPEEICEDLAADIARWLVDDPPLHVTEGGIIRQRADPALDELLELSLEGRTVVSRLEAREREQTGIASLKIKPHGQWGLVFELPPSQVERVPQRFIPRQQTNTCARYQTPELLELHEKVSGADVRRKTLEHQLFVQLRERVHASSARLNVLAGQLAALDALAALAEVAVRRGWTRPEVVEAARVELIASRHPVVEAALEPGAFLPNDIRLDAGSRRLVVLTGPNMAGKSTVLRQVAITVLLAHMGSFVPAERATVGLCDRVFTRVGAADDLARGQSTFMVEMAETASILHHATPRSVVLLDEIGRGTSTYDGLSIAWSVAEDLVDRVGCLGMFATHYHELCELAETRPAVANQSVAVSEQGERILFLRKLKEGGASRSYGIQCARIAGLPGSVVARARSLLKHFEKHAPRNERQQLSLFGAAPRVVEPEPEPVDRLREALAGIDPDALSPREAHEALYRLRGLL
jgi:DNA mismatch repair protein MutS